jgi:uncharacterized protein (TIGR02246 family)
MVRIAVITVLLAIACLSRAQTDGAAKNKDMPAFLRQLGDTRKSIADGYVAWTEAAKTRNLDAILGLYTDNAVVLPDGDDAVSGKQAIRAFYANWFTQPDKLVDQKFEEINSLQEGDLLVESERFSETVLKDGREVSLKGKRLTVWQRDLQGQWKMLRDIWNRSQTS